ncbi:hypothetical protein N2152v2_003145 [Parachlorella kessleri]
MADFVDDRAEESEEEERAEGKEKGAEEGSEDADSSEEEEEQDDWEDDGFIVRDDEEEEDGEGAGSDQEAKKALKKKKKRRREQDLQLEEDDYELLEENTGIRRPRPSQHRRIKKARDIGGGQHETADALKEQLFGPAEELEDELEDVAPAKAAGRGAREGGPVGGTPGGRAGGRGGDERHGGGGKRGQEGGGDGFSDEEDNWLVHEDEEEDGPPGERRRRRRAIMASMPGVDADAMEEAQDIFGDVGDLLAMYEARKREVAGGMGDYEDDYEGLEAEDLSDEEAAEELRRKREERRREAAARRMQEQLDPEAMARHYMLPSDEKIRDTDLPEREQLHRGPDPQEVNLDACAQWIWDQLLGDASVRSVARNTLEDGVLEVEGPPPPWYGSERWHHGDLKGDPHTELHGQRGIFKGRDREGRKAWRHNAAAQEGLRASIRAVLQELYERHNEVPFIGMYRKEVCGELLATREEDEPHFTTRDEPNFPRGAVQAKHRRVRRWDLLWAVHALAQRWRELGRRKEARLGAYQRAAEAAAAAAPGAQAGGGEAGAGAAAGEGEGAAAAALQRCVELLRDVQSQEALDDVEATYQLLASSALGAEDALSQLSVHDAPGSQGAGASGTPSAGRRRPQKSSAYALCRRLGLGAAVRGMVLSVEQFGDNVDAGYKRHEPPDPRVPPEEYFAAYVSDAAGFGDAESVMRGAVLMAAAEVGVEPSVRQHVREVFWEFGSVTTEPTPAGETALDPFHPLGPVKRLRHKLLRAFEGTDLFLRAEKEGLVRVRLGLADPEQHGLGSILELYCSGGAAALSQSWDAVRKRVLLECLRQHLLPGLEREARGRLAAQARAVVGQELCDRLWEHAAQAPLQVRLVDEEDFVPDRRVMAAVYGQGGAGGAVTTFVMLDPAGSLVDFLHCPQFSGHIVRQRARPGEVYDMFTDPRKSQDAARLRSFLEDHKPHVIVLGASHPEARALEADLKTIRDAILNDNPSFFIDLGTGDIATRLADESLAALWGTSGAAAEEFPASPEVVRKAVALGRQMLDPLALLAALCGPGREVLALQLHPLQASLPEEERMAGVVRTLCTVVAQVGVDLNAVASTPWLQPPLQFVPGLGPRKAAALLRAVTRSGGFVESRNQVWRELGVMGNRVFRNCGAYLRVRAAVKGMANLELDPLDDTRVHPESYQHAIAIAQSAVAGGGDEAGEVAVENALARPQDVESLDLEAYAAHLAGEGAGNKLATLIDIQQEFVRPYGELRHELAPPTAGRQAGSVVLVPRRLPGEGGLGAAVRLPAGEGRSVGHTQQDEDIFWLCSGETKDTLRPGRKVEARIRYVTEEDARCVLPDINNLEAVIRAQDVSSSADRVDCRDFLKPNDTVTARVRFVDPQQGLIELTTRSRDLNSDLHWEREYLGAADESYYVPDETEVRRAEADRRRQQNKRNFVSRPIRHPLFKNVSLQDSVAELLAREGAEPGEAVIRPHGKGPHMLALTLLLPDQLVQHVDIKEGAKASGASHLTLGSPLTVDIVFGKKTESYDDLDELTARYLEPIQSLMHKLVAHRKFRRGSWETLQVQLSVGAPATSSGLPVTHADSGVPAIHRLSVGLLQEQLRSEKQRQDPRMAAYLVAVDHNKPGLFYLGFIISQRPHREYFTVTPDGYHFRQRDFPSLDHLIAEWKKRPYGTSQQQHAQQAQQAQPPAPPPPQAEEEGPYAQEAQQVPPPPPGQYGGYYDGQQYGAYPQQEYQGYAPTQAYQEPGEYPPQPGGQYPYNGAAQAPAAGGYGYEAGAPPPPGYQEGYGPNYAAQQQYGHQAYGAAVGPQQPAMPPQPPTQQYGGPPVTQGSSQPLWPKHGARR